MINIKTKLGVILATILTLSFLCLFPAVEEIDLLNSGTKASGEFESLKTTMAWDYVGTVAQNFASDKKNIPSGLDVLSPTWFVLKDAEGRISSVAHKQYTIVAHNNNVKVWAMLSNEFNSEIPYQVFSVASKRQNVITEILRLCSEYELDGINLDFEGMTAETGSFYNTFVQELYLELKPRNITLSIDIPFPQYVNGFDIVALSKNSDYLIIMAYDQHYVGGLAGPMAAIDWVKSGLNETLSQIDSQKVILGVPFYSRLWVSDKKQGDRVETTSREYGMDELSKFFINNKANMHREKDTEQIFAEFEQGHNKYFAWLEDEHSLSLKLDQVYDFNLAGMAAWRKGLEADGIWDMIYCYYKNGNLE